MTDRIYTAKDLEYVEQKKDAINNFSSAYGVSATTVAAAIAKENSRYNKHDVLNDIQDNYAVNSLNTNYAVVSSSAAAKQVGWVDKPAGIGNIILNPSVIDVGLANIKVATAVQLLNDYYLKNPNSDPLELNSYKGNYQNVSSVPTLSHQNAVS